MIKNKQTTAELTVRFLWLIIHCDMCHVQTGSTPSALIGDFVYLAGGISNGNTVSSCIK